MNKTELINAIAAESGLTKKDSKAALEATLKAVTKALSDGEKVSLIGFGTFSVVNRAARQGVNPSTGKPMQIKAKNIAKFKPGAQLADAVK